MLASRPATKLALLIVALCCADAVAQAPFGLAETPRPGAAQAFPQGLQVAYDDSTIEAARKKAQAARKAYEDARDNSTAEDWVYVNPEKNPLGMRRFRRPEYEARLAGLERKARQAEEDLARLERER